MAHSIAPNLQGLLHLAQKDNAEARPSLIRIITDLYVMNPAPDAEEIGRYAELALPMLARADESVRVAVAASLARHGATPGRVAAKLARDVIAVAQPVLMHSAALDDRTLADIVRSTTPAHALAICGRESVGPETALALLAHDDDGVRNIARRFAQTEPARRPLEAANDADDTAETGPAAAEPVETAPASGLFVSAFDLMDDADPLYRGRTTLPADELARHARALLASRPEERAPLIARTIGIRAAQAGRTASAPVPSELMQAAFDAAATARSPSEVAALFTRIGALPRDVARNVVADGGGELLAIACRAARLPRMLTQRILMFVNPLVGHSVERHYAALDLFTDIDPLIADAIVATWRGESRAPKHVPLADDAPGVRRAAHVHAAGAERLVPAETAAKNHA